MEPDARAASRDKNVDNTEATQEEVLQMNSCVVTGKDHTSPKSLEAVSFKKFNAYRAYGLRMLSALALPELALDESAQESAAQTVVIRFGRVPSLIGESKAKNGCYYAHDQQVIFAYPNVGRFQVRAGSEIVIDPVPGVEEAVLRLYVLGVAMAMLLHQRGHLVLHASAVSINGGAVLFLGGKGYGKSTMATVLHERGHPLISDDVVAISLSENNKPLVFSGFPQVKLWPEAVEAALGKEAEMLPRLYSKVQKRRHRPKGSPAPDVLPLQTLFVLGFGANLNVRTLDIQNAFVELVRHTFLRKLLKTTGGALTHMRQCEELLSHLSVKSLERPRDLSMLSSVARFVEKSA